LLRVKRDAGGVVELRLRGGPAVAGEA
jgi:hypothetical protein